MLACATSKPTDGLTSGCERCSSRAYDLWLDWRLIKDFLAQTFIDYEPGIHISQLQMQSGTTRNTLRIYNPVKQGMDHDPEATFIRQWVPEIARLSTPEIHDWELTTFCGRQQIIPSIFDHAEAVGLARQRFREIRTNANYKSESERFANYTAVANGQQTGPGPARRKNERDSTSKTRHQVGNVDGIKGHRLPAILE